MNNGGELAVKGRHKLFVTSKGPVRALRGTKNVLKAWRSVLGLADVVIKGTIHTKRSTSLNAVALLGRWKEFWSADADPCVGDA